MNNLRITYLGMAESMDDFGIAKRRKTINGLISILKGPLELGELELGNVRELIMQLQQDEPPKTEPCPMEFEDTDPNCEVPFKLK